jgi:hypothetical protein
MSIRCYTWRAAPEVAAEYLRVVRQFGSNDQMGLWAEDYVHGHAGRLLWDVDYLTANFRFTSCLNVGGAPYLFEYLLKKSNQDLGLATLDLDIARFPRAGEVLGTKVIQMDVEQISSASLEPAGKYECVVFCEVFEHLRINILQTMKTVAQLLAPDGMLYLTMPNGLGLSAWLTKFTKGRTGPAPVPEWLKLSQIGHMGHVREYSVQEIQEVLEACGLGVDHYFFRRQSSFRGTTRSRIRDTAQVVAAHFLPSLGDEVGVVAANGSEAGARTAGTGTAQEAQ